MEEDTEIKEMPDVGERKIFVSDFMTKTIIYVNPFFTLEKAVDVLLANNISGVPVIDKKYLVGEISRTDILNLVGKQKLEDLTKDDMEMLRKMTVEEVMKKPICINYDKNLEEAKKEMDKYGIKRLFVIDGKEHILFFNSKKHLIGIITKTDLLKGVVKEEIKKTVHTTIDDMLKLLQEGRTDFSRISKSLNIPENLVEDWAKILEDHGLVEISYPVVGSPVVKLKNLETPK
jgi:CBS domain-containing protein